MKFAQTLAIAALVSASLITTVDARTKLVTLPGRDAMVVNLSKSGQTLIYEEREITLQAGNNDIDFSWQGVSIDQSSIRVEMLTNPGDDDESTKIIDVSFPPNEAALTWKVYTPEARTELVRVSYLLSGISTNTSYEFVVNSEETESLFQQYVRVDNTSGEDLEDAQLRVPQSDDWKRSVDSGESRRFLAVERDDVPINKLFISKPSSGNFKGETGEDVSLVYEIENSKESKLGDFLLDYGKARIFSEDPDGSTVFLGEDYILRTPTRESAELSLGLARDIVFKRFLQSRDRENQRYTTNNRALVLYDEVIQYRYELENFKDDAATLRIIEVVMPDVEIVEHHEDMTIERLSATELQIEIDLEGREAYVDEPAEMMLVMKRKDVIN